VQGHRRVEMFPPGLSAGEIGFCDFPRKGQAGGINSAGLRALSHLLFHTAWPWSGWPTARLGDGGESLCGSLRRVQNALGRLRLVCPRAAATDRPFGCQSQSCGSYAIDINAPLPSPLRPLPTLLPAATPRRWPQENGIVERPMACSNVAAGAEAACCAAAVKFRRAGRITASLLSEVFQCLNAPRQSGAMSRSVSRSWAPLPAFSISQITKLPDCACCVQPATIEVRQFVYFRAAGPDWPSGHGAAAP